MSQSGKTQKQATKPVLPASPKPFRIPYPLLWLALLVVMVYSVSFNAGLTELDDTIFIRDFHTYNEDLSNLFTSFKRGVFSETQDTYYRPLFLDAMILNFQLSGPDVSGYHFVNILLHLGAVLLLYRLLVKLDVAPLHAFILTGIFAVHPVLSQAVAWIPGRNDTLLAIFSFSFFIAVINYARQQKIYWLGISLLWLLCALFTKETGVFNLPVAFVLLWMTSDKKLFIKDKILQYSVWVLAFLIWFGVRNMATLKQSYLQPGKMLVDFIGRLPLIVQYLGKIFLPFNLSVFPMVDDTVIWNGLVSVVILTALIFLNKERKNKKLLAGLGIFLLYLLPVLLVPRSLNEQSFEHRLYLPFLGILLCLDETILLQNKLKNLQLFGCGVVLIATLSFANVHHQQYFNNPHAFWQQAVTTSPHSAYANMMLGARTDEVSVAEQYFRKAYTYNPNEKYLNFYFGVMLQKKDSVLASEPYLLKEKNSSGYYECDFYLARVAFEKKDLTSAAQYLETYLTRDSLNEQANNNILLLYIQTQQKDKALAQAQKMQHRGLTVPPQVMNGLQQ